MIVISYRRADSAGFTRALRERLVDRFGEARIFLDVETIEAGADFRERLRLAVSQCEALLVVIGPHWLGDTGHARLDDPADAVRLEITTALAQAVRIIPVLVEGATMPAASALPVELRALADRNAVTITNERFESDVDHLLRALEPARGRARALLPVLAVLLLVLPCVLWLHRWAHYTALLVTLALLAAVSVLVAARSRVWRASQARVLAPGLSAVAFALVLLGGLARNRPGPPFTLTVRVHGPVGEGDSLAQGEMVLDLGSERKQQPINRGGDAVFAAVPGRFSGDTVTLLARIAGYDEQPQRVAVPPSHVVVFQAVKREYRTPVHGSVLDRAGHPLAGVHLDFGNGMAGTDTDEQGNFALPLPVPVGTVLQLRATRNGTTGYDDTITVPAGPLEVRFVPGG